MIQENAAEKIHGELLLALQMARNRFSVAIAAETKSTSRDRWRHYIETTDRIGRCIKTLRKADSGFQMVPREWEKALETLCSLPVQGRASRICEILRDIVAEIEGSLHFLSA